MTRGEAFIKAVLGRRALIIILSLSLIGLGIYSFRRLPIEAYPNIAPLNIEVVTQWPGRSTLEVERQITVPVETALAGIPDTAIFRSSSLFGLSDVIVQFKDGADSFRARHNVALYLSDAELPDGVQPELSPDADALGEILRFRIEAKDKDIDLITQKSYEDWEIYKSLRTVPGVADIDGFGGMVKQYQVLPSPDKMQLYQVSLEDLVDALQNANGNVGGDYIGGGEQRYVIRGVGLLQTLDDMRRVVVAVNNGVPVRVSDLAEVRIGNEPRLGRVAFNDQEDVVEGVVLMRRGENASDVLKRVRAKIKEINLGGMLPAGMKLVPFYDRQNLLDMTTRTVSHNLLFGMGLVLVVLFIFLGNLRAALAVAAVIPIALCVSFIGMHLLEVPANLISLGAIDFGLIMDAAVIVVENIMRQMEREGRPLNETIVDAVAEVARPMIFSTIIIVAAYSPLFFLGGVEGKIFKPMAFTMGIALLASIALSLTTMPAANSILFRGGIRPHTPGFLGWILKYYRPLLDRLVRNPLPVIAASLLVLGLALFAATRLGTSFLPTLEENNLWIKITLPNTVDLPYSTGVASEIRKYLRAQPEVEDVLSEVGRSDEGTEATGVYNLEFGVYLKNPHQWVAKESKEALVHRLEKYFEAIPGIEYDFSQYIQENVSEALTGVKGENAVKIFGPDLSAIDAKATQIEAIMESVPGIVDVGTFRELGQPTLNVNVDREKCARFGVNVSDIENLVLNAIGGEPVTQILEGERKFDLALRFPEPDRDTLEKIRRLLVDAPDGSKIPLNMIASVELTDGPFFIYRELARRYIAVKFGVRDRDLGGAVAEARARINKEVQLPPGYSLKWDGEFNEMKVAQKKLAVIIPLTLLAIFLLLYAALGDAVGASIVILNVTFAAIGGIAALWFAGEELSISAGIGFLSLFGIAIQDAVILTSYVMKLRKAQAPGDDPVQAVVDGSSLRFRPVLMTALLAAFGLLPAALSHAIGSQAQRPLALVIVGGMVTTTTLTLLVHPVIYSYAKGYHRPKNPA